MSQSYNLDNLLETKNDLVYVAGTDTKVASVGQFSLQGSDPHQINSAFPALSLHQIHAALAYYHLNLANIENPAETSIEQKPVKLLQQMDTNLLIHLLDVSRRLAEIRDMPTLLNLTIDEVLRLVGAERGYIVIFEDSLRDSNDEIEQLLTDPDAIRFQVRRSNDETDIVVDEDLVSRSILAHVFTSGQSLVVPDAMFDLRFADKQSVIEFGIRSVMCVPLMFENITLGAIYVENRSLAGKFEAESLIPLEYFRLQVVAILSRIRLDDEHRLLQKQQSHSRRLEALGQLSGGIAHDLNNFLLPIATYLDLGMAVVNPNDKIHQYLEIIQSQIERVSQLTQQILAFGRKQVLDPKLVDLNKVLIDFEGVINGLLTDNIEIDIQASSSPLPILADRVNIEQVLLNLAINARDSMPYGGKLVIKVFVYQHSKELNDTLTESFVGGKPTEGKYVGLQVCDNGVGINDEILDRIFEPFFTTKSESGTGLGLATVIGIVKQHNGNLAVASKLGKGTTFSIYFPFPEKLSMSDLKQPTDDKVATVHRKLSGFGTILIVDDNAGVRNALHEALQLEGYTVHTEASSEAALNYLQNNIKSVGLVLTDLSMPEMNGLDLAQQIKMLDQEMRIILMSGYSEQVFITSDLDFDQTDFIQKPFDPSVILQKIAQMM